MIPAGLKLYNFTAYGADTPELDFRPLQLVVLSGVNGAGKSSILDSITWAVWGWSRAGDSADQLVRLGTKEMWVDLTFELEGVEYQIIRARKIGNPGSTTLQFFGGGGKTNLTEGTIKATQEKIIQTLHLSYDTFVNSSYIRQDRANEFTIKSPNERKEILADILGLSTYDLLEEGAKLKAREAEEKIALLDIQLQELSTELESSAIHKQTQSKTETDLKASERALESAEKALAEVNSRRESHLTKYEAARVKAEQRTKIDTERAQIEMEMTEKKSELLEFKNLIADKENIEKGFQELLDIRSQIQNLEPKQAELVTMKDKIADLMTKISSIDAELEGIKREGSALDDEYKKQDSLLKEARQNEKRCPTCKQKIEEDVHKKVVEDIQSEVNSKKASVEALRLKWRQKDQSKKPIQNELNEKNVVKTALEKEIEGLSRLQNRRDDLQHYESLKTRLTEDLIKAKAAKESYLKLNERLEKNKKELTLLPEVNLIEIDLELTSLEREKNEKDALYRERQREHIFLREKMAEAKQLVTRATQVGKMIKDKQNERNEAGIRKTDYEDLATAFGKRGIQAMLIESAIPEIEDEANALLDRMTDGRMKVQLLTQRESKTGDPIETLDIIISDELGARPYEMYSGGESFRINLALRLALSRLLTHRAGAKLQFLIIDEGFGTQDAQGKYKVVEAINAIRDDFAKILVVTHDPELKEAFPQRIEVSRGSNGSTFEVFA